MLPKNVDAAGLNYRPNTPSTQQLSQAVQQTQATNNIRSEMDSSQQIAGMLSEARRRAMEQNTAEQQAASFARNASIAVQERAGLDGLRAKMAFAKQLQADPTVFDALLS